MLGRRKTKSKGWCYMINLGDEVAVEICEWGGRAWRRYPGSPRRSHRVYFQSHASWNETPLYLHREIWKSAHGPIPEGYEIHHVDENPLNNTLENLECLTAREHRRRHRQAYRSQRQLEHLRKIRPAALVGLAKWKASAEGIAALREQGRKVMEARPLLDFRCQHCGIPFRSKQARSMFCSPTCQQKAHPTPPKHQHVCRECRESFFSARRVRDFCGRRCSSLAREKAKRARAGAT
jgi:ferredoxin